jgi:hypothetical protein
MKERIEKYEQYLDLKKLYDEKQKQEPIYLNVLGSAELDYKIYPGVSVIAGITGSGKSMFANSIAYDAVVKGLNVLYITLEVSKENTFYQMISQYSLDYAENEGQMIVHSDIKAGSLSDYQIDLAFNKYYEGFKNLPGNLHVLEEWDFDTTDPKSLIGRMIEVEDYSIEHSGRGIDLIIVDYIQLFKRFEGGSNSSEYEIISQWVNFFRQMSLVYLRTPKATRKMPIILVSQLNRDAWKEKLAIDIQNAKNNCKPENKRNKVREFTIDISQIAGCAEIVKAASQVFAIYSDEGLKASNQCQIFHLKNRDGETRVEPLPTYMNPKYYHIGKTRKLYDEDYNGILDDILGINMSLDVIEKSE